MGGIESIGLRRLLLSSPLRVDVALVRCERRGGQLRGDARHFGIPAPLHEMLESLGDVHSGEGFRHHRQQLSQKVADVVCESAGCSALLYRDEGHLNLPLQSRIRRGQGEARGE